MVSRGLRVRQAMAPARMPASRRGLSRPRCYPSRCQHQCRHQNGREYRRRNVARARFTSAGTGQRAEQQDGTRRANETGQRQSEDQKPEGRSSPSCARTCSVSMPAAIPAATASSRPRRTAGTRRVRAVTLAAQAARRRARSRMVGATIARKVSMMENSSCQPAGMRVRGRCRSRCRSVAHQTAAQLPK